VNFRLLGVLASVLGLALVPVMAAPVAAKTPSTEAPSLDFDSGGKAEPVSITADNGIEWRQADRVYIARGNVKAVRGTVTVYADEMRAYYRPVANKSGKAATPPAPTPPPPASPATANRAAKSKSAKSGQPPATATDEGPTEVYRLEALGNVRFVTPTQTGYGDHADYNVDTTLLVMTGRHMRIVTPHDQLSARDSIEWYDNRQLGVARGDAVDIHDGKTLSADILLATIAHAPGQQAQISRIDGRGNVFVSSQDQIGRGDAGVYDAKTGVVTLQGHVRLTRDKDEMRGDYGVVDVNRNVGYLLPKPPHERVAEGSHRVEALVMPDNKKGVPTAIGSTGQAKKPGKSEKTAP
jgi:lipopolysaccharide export system protein LptA